MTQDKTALLPEGLEAAAKVIAADVLGYAWDGVGENSIVDKGFKPFYYSSFGGLNFQGGHKDLEACAASIVAAYLAATRPAAGAGEALVALEELANMPLGISLEDWCRLSGPILAALRSLPPDDGFVVVPKEPTREMWAAMGNAVYGHRNRHHDKVAADLWNAALAAMSTP